MTSSPNRTAGTPRTGKSVQLELIDFKMGGKVKFCVVFLKRVEKLVQVLHVQQEPVLQHPDVPVRPHPGRLVGLCLRRDRVRRHLGGGPAPARSQHRPAPAQEDPADRALGHLGTDRRDPLAHLLAHPRHHGPGPAAQATRHDRRRREAQQEPRLDIQSQPSAVQKHTSSNHTQHSLSNTNTQTFLFYFSLLYLSM
jgi:hypothetical protein